MLGWASLIFLLYKTLRIPFGCPSEGTWVGNECFAYYGDNLNWNDARAACQKRGGDLPAPHDLKKFLMWLNTWETFENNQEYSRFKPAPWVGATFGDRFIKLGPFRGEKYISRSWEWLDGQHLSVDDSSWYYNRPKKEKGHCVAVYSDTQYSNTPRYTLFEEPCTDRLPYMCEYY